MPEFGPKEFEVKEKEGVYINGSVDSIQVYRLEGFFCEQGEKVIVIIDSEEGGVVLSDGINSVYKVVPRRDLNVFSRIQPSQRDVMEAIGRFVSYGFSYPAIDYVHQMMDAPTQ